MVIVLETSGQYEFVDNVRVKLFDNWYHADVYCKSVSDEEKKVKYWRFAEIIEEGKEYEVTRCQNL